MVQRRVLIIEHDEWQAALLGKVLNEAGYEVHNAGDARSGFDKIRQLDFVCILCDVHLPDIDGFWVARRLRAEPSAVSATPFLFLTELGDTESRLLGFQVGADLDLVKPCRGEEVVAQVGALLAMASRLRERRDEEASPDRPPPPSRIAFEGDVAQMSVATVLTLLELERRTGRLQVMDEAGHDAVLSMRDGAFAGATLDGSPTRPPELLREILSWSRGHFWFRSDAVSDPPRATFPTIGGLLLEAMRLEDESER